MKVLVTGAGGFIARNLIAHLSDRGNVDIMTFSRKDSGDSLQEAVRAADMIFHLAGVNRPENEAEFFEGNAGLTETLCQAVRADGRAIPIIYSSSTQAGLDNPYGKSKLVAEQMLQDLHSDCACPVYIFRLPGVFGKWSKPNYNSVVSTFCYQIANGIPVHVSDPGKIVRLVYIDDVAAEFLRIMDHVPAGDEFMEVAPVYETTLGALAEAIASFRQSRTTLSTGAVGTGLTRALYSTYLSYFTPGQFSYPLIRHADPRGVFVEMLKTPDAGQVSYFTAHPGVTRGGHYHHTKTEKFLVIRGRALFRFRHVATNAEHEISVEGSVPEVVETIPGWSHDITNVGDDELIVMLWANEVFDRQKPDTITYKVCNVQA